ncbi:MAG: hypothetical protein EHM61_01285 [Acidobacteria bacterium]|nr:MAG: hypothetical protein EHM61_01285 [Acidobacteriota bacterium]
MNQNIRHSLRLGLILLFTVVMAGTCFAATFNLRTGTMTKTMPDGVVVTMWGFALDAGPIQVPGPVLTVPAGDTELVINLTNGLTVPVSIVVPGQTTGAAGVASAMTPVWIDPVTFAVTATGTRPAGNFTSRMRSLNFETAPGTTGVYSWTNLQPGTYLYKSGTHMQVQVPMGLYGAMTKNVVDPVVDPLNPLVMLPGQAYTGVSFDAEQVLVYSDIDPDLNAAVAGGSYGADCAVLPCMTSTIDNHPHYYLINGEPFSYSRSPLTIGPATKTTLLRFLNAGNEDYVPTLQASGMQMVDGDCHMHVVAEDGKALPFAKEQYQLLLAPGKTLDTWVQPAAEGYIPLFDRRGHLTNATQVPGGLLVYLAVPNIAPVPLTVTLVGSGTGKVQAVSAPAGIDTAVLDLAENYNPGTVIALKATPAPGSDFSGWSGGFTGMEDTAVVTVSAPTSLMATFTAAIPLTVVYPNGGETWTRGSIQTIRWAYAGSIGPYVRIELWQTGTAGDLSALQTVIKAGAPTGTGGVGSFMWRVPSGLPPLDNFKVVIKSLSDATITDASDGRFTVVLP